MVGGAKSGDPRDHVGPIVYTKRPPDKKTHKKTINIWVSVKIEID